jgi:hypothetical protein
VKSRTHRARNYSGIYLQNPRVRCKSFLHFIPEPEENTLGPLHDSTANDTVSTGAGTDP